MPTKVRDLPVKRNPRIERSREVVECVVQSEREYAIVRCESEMKLEGLPVCMMVHGGGETGH